jgi:hypothetical protein
VGEKRPLVETAYSVPFLVLSAAGTSTLCVYSDILISHSGSFKALNILKHLKITYSFKKESSNANFFLGYHNLIKLYGGRWQK